MGRSPPGRARPQPSGGTSTSAHYSNVELSWLHLFARGVEDINNDEEESASPPRCWRTRPLLLLSPASAQEYIQITRLLKVFTWPQVQQNWTASARTCREKKRRRLLRKWALHKETGNLVALDSCRKSAAQRYKRDAISCRASRWPETPLTPLPGHCDAPIM